MKKKLQPGNIYIVYFASEINVYRGQIYERIFNEQ